MARRGRKTQSSRPSPVGARPASPAAVDPPSPTLEARAAAAGWAMPALVALGLVLRFAHLVALDDSPFASSLQLDARYYDVWAQKIAAGQWIGDAPFWLDPLYAYLLGTVYAVGGHHLIVPRVLQLGFGIATVVLVARIAERAWQSRAAALAAALLMVTFIPSIYFEGQMEKTALTLLLVSAVAVVLLHATTWRGVLAAGVLTGLSALARGNTLLFAPFLALVLALGWDRERERPTDDATATDSRRARWTRAALFLGGVLPLVLLATLHNWVASRQLVPITSNLGVNLYLGNHTGNAFGYYEAPPFLRPETFNELPDFRAEALKRTGQAMTDQELSTYWSGQAWQAVRDEPGLAIKRTLRKLELALHDDELPDNEDVRMVGEWSPVLRSPLLWFGQLLPLGVLGVVAGWRRRRVRLVAALAAVYLASLLPFFVIARLRVQLAPLLAVTGGGGLVWLLEALGARRGRRVAVAAAVVIAVAVAAHVRPEWMARRRVSTLAVAWNNLGASLSDSGRADEAIRAYERAIDLSPTAVPASLRALANLRRQRGELDRAEAVLRRLVEIKPDSRSARDSLVSLYAAMLADPRWRSDARIRERAAALAPPPAPSDGVRQRVRRLVADGDHAEAIRVLQESVRTGPYDEGLHYLLGDLMERHATPDDTIRFFSGEATHDQKPQTSHYFWSLALARRGDVDGAIARLREALTIDPAHEMSQRQWGLLLERQGHPAEALDHLLEATRIHPDFRAALEDAARVAATLGRSADAESYRARAAKADPNTPKRFLYWARYLHEHGRDAAAAPEIQLYLQQRPGDAEGTALRDQIDATLGRTKVDVARSTFLSATARAALLGRLRARPGGVTWIAYDGRTTDARDLATDLAAVFKEAGWTVRSLTAARFALRPGLFLFVAGPATETTNAAQQALERAGLKPTVGTEYRAYSDSRRRADPAWQGPQLEPDQDYVILVGRR